MRDELFNLYARIQFCTACKESEMDVNKCGQNFKDGKGKIIGTGNYDKCKILFVAQNPSTQRYPNLFTPCDDGLCKKFKDLLVANGNVWKDCFLTNLVKCSVAENVEPDRTMQETCYREWFTKEVDLLSPEKIICLGSNSYNYLKDKVECTKIYHPGYIYNYHRMDEITYLKMIMGAING